MGSALRPRLPFCGMIASHSSRVFMHTTQHLSWCYESAVILMGFSCVGDGVNLESESLGLNEILLFGGCATIQEALHIPIFLPFPYLQ